MHKGHTHKWIQLHTQYRHVVYIIYVFFLHNNPYWDATNRSKLLTLLGASFPRQEDVIMGASSLLAAMKPLRLGKGNRGTG